MKQARRIRDVTKPQHVLMACDAMTGQDAVVQAREFMREVDTTGFVLTKLDGDARGGAALSMTHVTGRPIYFAGTGETVDDLDRHRLIVYGSEATPPPVPSLNWVQIAGHDGQDRAARRAALLINNVYGMLRAAERGLGVASLPDYLCSTSRRLVRVLPQLEGPTFDAYFVYPEEMRASKRVSVFRDFLLRKLAEQPVW